jgi:hypothetical protein
MDWHRSLVGWLTDNPATWIELIFAGVVAWAAWVGVNLNRRLAAAELDPAITVYLERDRLHFSFFDLVIRNAGRGTARNVKLRAEPDIPVDTTDEDSRLSRMAIFQRGVSMMGPLQEIRTFYGSYPQAPKEPITIHVTYDRELPGAIQGRAVRTTFVIDITQFGGLSRVGEPPELTATKALDQIATDLRHIRWGGSWWTPTVTVRRRYFFSAPVNRCWSHYSRRWRNFRIRWVNREELWRRRWERFRSFFSK